MYRVIRLRAGLVFASLLCVLVLAGCNSTEERAQAHYERGVELAAKGEPAKAGLEFRNALKLKKDFVDALYALGEVEERQGHFENASKFYFSVTESSPQHVGARVKLAYILLAAGNADEALKFANQAIAITEDDPSVLVVKAAVELKRGNRKGAVNLANQALKLDPEYVDALMVLAADRLKDGDPSAALQFLEKAPKESERNIGLQILRLTALDALGDQPGVEKLFSKLVELFPETPAFREGLVQWYLGKGRKEDAERTIRDYAAANPADEKAQFRLIAFLNTVKGPASAIEELEKLISDHGKNDDLNYKLRMALGQLQFTSGDRAKAMDLTQSIVAATDGDKRNDARIALAKMAATEQKLDEAENSVNAVISEDPKNADALGVRAWVRLAKNKVSEATDDLLVAVNEAPQNAQLIGLLGEAYERAGLATLAEEQYAKALSISPNPADAGMQMAQFHLRYGRTEQARRVLEEVLAKAPTDRRVLTLLARLRLTTQDWVGAQEIADKLRTLDKDKKDTTADKIAAAALGGLGRHSDSINLLKASLSTDGDQQAVLGDLVRAYVQAGQMSDAEGLLVSQIEKNPKNAQAHVLLGSIYASTQRTEAAEKAFKDAVAVDNGPLSQVALAQFYLASGRLDDAEKTARAGIARDPTSNTLRFLLASILQRTERFSDAIALYEDMYKADPESTAVANDLASLLSERRGDPASLERAFTIAQRFRNSEIPQYVDTLGWIYYLRGEYASALPLIKSAAGKLPNVGLVQYHLGMVQKELGQNDLSIASLEKAISQQASMTPTDLEKAQSAIDEQRAAAASSVSN